MEHACRAGKTRGSKDLSDRNIAVGNTVLKIRLFRRIVQMMQHHAQIRSVLSFSKHMHGNTLVERIDQVLLDALVFFRNSSVLIFTISRKIFS